MSVNFSKRFASFIIDVLIIMFVTSILYYVVPMDKTSAKNVETMNKELMEVFEKGISGEMDVTEYTNQTASLQYRIDKENFLYTSVSLVVTILYYVVFQFATKGQTMGKKVMGIKVVKQEGDLHINDFIFRCFIINGILYSMVTLVALFTTKDMAYSQVCGFMLLVQGSLIVISSAMVLFRSDRLALQDIVTKTKVVRADVLETQVDDKKEYSFNASQIIEEQKESKTETKPKAKPDEVKKPKTQTKPKKAN